MRHNIMASEAAGWCEGKLYGFDIPVCRAWKSDSRDIKPGDAFVALKGSKADGHMFVRQALERGASLLLVNLAEMDKLAEECPDLGEVSVIAVSDTSVALARMAQMYLEVQNPKVAGITGSVGKTTTRELVVSVLKRSNKVHSAIRSFNTLIGCSLTILAMPADTDILVLELGTSHFGEIKEMVSFFPLDLAIITEIAPAHLEGFGSVEGVLRAKLEICGSVKLRTVIYNADNYILNEYMSYNLNNITKIAVGKKANADLRITAIKNMLDETGGRIEVSFTRRDDSFSVKANLFGAQHAYNLGYACAAGEYFGIPRDEIIEALAEFKPIAGRGICKRTKYGAWVIDESYNANPSSMSAAIDNVLTAAEGKKYKLYAVLGGMRELGSDFAYWHQAVLERLAGFERVFLLGDEWYEESLSLPENATRFRTFDELVHAFPYGIATSESIILIKGSNVYNLKKLVVLLTEAEDVY